MTVHSSTNPANGSRRKFTTGVSLEPEVVSYLDQLAARTGLNRSWLLNTIVTEHAHLAGYPLTAALEQRPAIIR